MGWVRIGFGSVGIGSDRVGSDLMRGDGWRSAEGSSSHAVDSALPSPFAPVTHRPSHVRPAPMSSRAQRGTCFSPKTLKKQIPRCARDDTHGDKRSECAIEGRQAEQMLL